MTSRPRELPESVERRLIEALDAGSDALAHAARELSSRDPSLAPEIDRWIQVARADTLGLTRGESTLHPKRIGPYEIVEVLGQGGMGTVYLAKQHSPLERRVALKLVRRGMQSRAIEERFELERQTLASMNHDAIAKVFECGTSEQGLPYFVMELVEGLPLTEYCTAHRLSVRDRISLFRTICQGVEHAHQKGVVHRDLKPANLMVRATASGPAAKIIDFGIARVTDMPSGAQPATLHGSIVGTPDYMAPEQATGTSRLIDTRTDVFALGVVLYELMTGALPFPPVDTSAAGIAELQRRLREDTPPRPSARVADGANTGQILRSTGNTQRQRELRGELDWIVMKAMATEPGQRYASVGALADDLRRFLAHEPVEAGPPSARYRIGKFVKRYRSQCLAIAMVALAVLGGGIAAWLGFAKASHRAAENEALLDDFDLLAAMVTLDGVVKAEQQLFPAWPVMIPAMESWLATCDAHLDLRRTFTDTLTRLRAREGKPTKGIAFLMQELQALGQELDRLEASHRCWVQARLDWARRLAAATSSHPQAGMSWEDVANHVAHDDRYRDTDLTLDPSTMIGLVPIGANPQTNLLEFYDLRTAWRQGSGVEPADLPIPRFRSDGTIAVDGSTGIVFVLLPGGPAQIGALSFGEGQTDPQAERDELPVSTVELSPYLIARHELTQGQWLRLQGHNPSCYPPKGRFDGARVTLAHPVEKVSWYDCIHHLTRQGMTLPTEAQWEYAARAGSRTPWWCGADPELLSEFANVADRYLKEHGGPEKNYYETWDDGWGAHAPVGSYPPNAFGLHDVHGNVHEWCRDWVSTYANHPPAAGDGLRSPNTDQNRAMRGGSWVQTSPNSRSSDRDGREPGCKDWSIGVRPVRMLSR